MSLDVVRAIHKTKGEAITAFHHKVTNILHRSSSAPALKKTSIIISQSLSDIISTLQTSQDNLELMARDLCLSLAQIYIAALLLEHAMATHSPVDLLVLENWCQRELCPVARYGMERYSRDMVDKEKELVYQLYHRGAAFPPQCVR
jgi:hypothetical protein